jgi:hypothetical protein
MRGLSMRHYSMPISVAAVACGLLAGATAVQAGTETWVSATGHDAGTCPITAPCRTFAFAHSQTANNGAINVLTSGNYGPLTITKPISIVADGVEAVINTAAGGAAIVVQAGAAAIISLRGLTIDLRGTANDGILFSSGGVLHVQNCVVRRSATGINVQPSGNVELHIADTVVAGTTSTGIFLAPNGGDANAVLERVRVEKSGANGIGFLAQNSASATTATVRDSVVSGNAGAGINVFRLAGTVEVMVNRTVSANNGTGIDSEGTGAVVRIGNSTVTGNTTHGLNTGVSGTIASYGTNRIDGNTGNETPSTMIARE